MVKLSLKCDRMHLLCRNVAFCDIGSSKKRHILFTSLFLKRFFRPRACFKRLCHIVQEECMPSLLLSPSLPIKLAKSRHLAKNFRMRAQAQALRRQRNRNLWPQLLKACSMLYLLENIGFHTCGQEIDKEEIAGLSRKNFSSSSLFRRS